MKLSSAQLIQPAPTERSQPGRNVRSARSLRSARTRWAPTVYQWSAPEMEKGSNGTPLAPFIMNDGAMTAVGQPAAAW